MHDPIVVGVDPGLVHTGVVMLDFRTTDKTLKIQHAVVTGLDAETTRITVESMAAPFSLAVVDIFIEMYRSRTGYTNDERMVQANAEFKKELGGTLTRNTGVKKIVSQQLMELCGVWKFSTTTHHQDLRSAARIALLGMMLDPSLNRVLFEFVRDNLEGNEWDVQAN